MTGCGKCQGKGHCGGKICICVNKGQKKGIITRRIEIVKPVYDYKIISRVRYVKQCIDVQIPYCREVCACRNPSCKGGCNAGVNGYFNAGGSGGKGNCATGKCGSN